MESKVFQTIFLLALISLNCNSFEDNDILGFDSQVRSKSDWIDPDDMGLPTKNLDTGQKLSMESYLGEFETRDRKNEHDYWKEKIKSLNSQITSLQHENEKLKQNNTALHKKYEISNSATKKSNNTSCKSGTAPSERMDSSREIEQTKGEELILLRYIKLLCRMLKLNVDNNELLPWKFENDDSRQQDRVLRYVATLRLNEKDIKIIQSLARSHTSNISTQLYNIDFILSNLILSARHETSEEMETALRIDYVALVAYYLPSENDLMWIAIVIVFLSISILLYTGKMNLWKLMGFLFFISSAWHWTRMYKKALTDKHITLSKTKHIPHECSPDSMSWGHYLIDSMFVRKDKCKEYYEALMIDPLLEVTPTMALAETFTAFVVQPLEHLGRHIGKFFNALLQETSWLSSPVILSFVFIAILLCMVMVFGYRFRLPFFLGSFEPRNNLSDSFAIERKEQHKMIVEFKTTLDALKDLHTPKKQISSLSYENSAEFESITCENRLSDKYLSNNKNANDHKSNLKFQKQYKQINHKRSSSSPSKIYPNSKDDSQSYCKTNSAEIGEKGLITKNLSSENLLSSNNYSEMSTPTESKEKSRTSQIYQSPPNKKLVVKKNDNDPNDTDFEWVTEMLGNKLDELQQETTDIMEECCENKQELKLEKTEFIEKAKDIFNDVLKD